MTRTISALAIIVILISAGISSAQTSALRLTFSEAIEPIGRHTGTITYTGLESPDIQVFEAIIPAATESACFASRDFSNARVVGPDRASVAYDATAGSYKLRWTQVKDKRDRCRVLIVGRSVAGGDLADWQANYGIGGLAESGFDSIRGDGSVRPIRHSISLTPAGSSATLSVVNPAGENELIRATFPDAPDRNFLIFEAVLPASTDAECLANTDLSTATPADPNRASAIYDPQTSLWHLIRSANTSSVPPCTAVLADGDGTVDAADFQIWRSNLGSPGFAENGAGLNGSFAESEVGAIRPRQRQITYAFGPVLREQ